MNPLKIYLDTSDYANFLSPVGSICDVYNYLLSKIDSEEIIICFSSVTIFEFIQEFDTEHIKDRLERADLLKKMCNGNCFRHIPYLNMSRDAYSQDGEWFPSVESMDIDVYLDAFMRAISNPRIPKMLARKMSNRKNLASFLKSNPGFLDTKNNKDKFNFFKNDDFLDKNILRNYAMGLISREKANYELRKSISDLSNFVYNYYVYQGAINMFQSVMHNFTHILERFIYFISTLHERMYSNNSFNEKELWQDLNSSYGKRSDIPIPRHLLPIIHCYSISHLRNAEMRFKRSDGGDIFNAAYIKYSDLWRGDRSFSNILFDCGYEYKERIVNSLSELPARIDAKLSELRHD